jgi:hypothetical protein
VVGLSRFELLTPRLSSVCSNQLSYRPSRTLSPGVDTPPCQRTGNPVPSKLDRTCAQQPAEHQIDLSVRFHNRLRDCFGEISRKEVIQPQVLLQLPCYDFTPITDHTLSAFAPCGFEQRFLVQPAFVM